MLTTLVANDVMHISQPMLLCGCRDAINAPSTPMRTPKEEPINSVTTWSVMPSAMLNPAAAAQLNAPATPSDQATFGDLIAGTSVRRKTSLGSGATRTALRNLRA